MKKIFLIFFIIFLVQCGPPDGVKKASGAVYSLPADRSITWQGNVGVEGDIPTGRTVYTTLSPLGGGQSDTAQINTAISNCPSDQIVSLSSGTFILTSQINFAKSSITLRGAGMGRTVLQAQAGCCGGRLVQMWPSGWDPYLTGQTSRDISSGLLSKGTYTITTSVAHGWSAGNLILIDQLNSASSNPPVANTAPTYGEGCSYCGRSNGTRSLGQLVEISEVPTTTTAVLDMPLYYNYDSTLTPQAVRATPLVKFSGIEDLTIDNTLGGTTTDAQIIDFAGVSNCWLLRVDFNGVAQSALHMWENYRNTIRGCKFHGHIGVLISGGGYAIWTEHYSSANLFEDNMFYDTALAITSNGANSGNVFAYNYIGNLKHGDTYAGLGSGWSSHGAHPIMNLVEGNYSEGGLAADLYHGTSSHNTFFRNFIKKESPLACYSGGNWVNCTQANFLINIMQYSRYYNVVGNIIGTLGDETVYEYAYPTSVNTSNKVIDVLGYFSSAYIAGDTYSASTLLRHANWDSVNNTQVWNGSDEHTLPDSLYLTSKPSWYGTLIWPPVVPSGPTVYDIPAKYRYDTGLDTPTGAIPFPSRMQGTAMGGGIVN